MKKTYARPDKKRKFKRRMTETEERDAFIKVTVFIDPSSNQEVKKETRKQFKLI